MVKRRIVNALTTERERSFVTTNNIRSHDAAAVRDDRDATPFMGKKVFETTIPSSPKRRRGLDVDGNTVIHYGSKSAVYAEGVYETEQSLFGTVVSFANEDKYDPFLCDSERVLAVQDMPATGAALANGFYGSYNRRGVYSSVNGNGDKRLVDCDSDTLMMVPIAATFVHAMGDRTPGVKVEVKDNVQLEAFLDASKPVGDTRTLTGLTSVIFGNRDQLNTTMRDYFLSGCRHSHSEWGYCKMWLYVLGLFQTREQIHVAGDPGFVMALNAGFAAPLVDDPAVGRANWDANFPGIDDDTVGWFFAPRAASNGVVDAMADFYRPFPSYTWQNAVFKPAAWRNSIPGFNVVVCTKPGGVAIPARAVPPSIQEYMEAIRHLASFRHEDGDAVRGLGLAMHLASGRRATLAADVLNGVAAEEYVIPATPSADAALVFRPPISNTILAAYLAGRNGVAVPRLAEVVKKRRFNFMRALHARTLISIYVNERALQIGTVTASSIDRTYANVAVDTERDAVLNAIGTVSKYSASYTHIRQRLANVVFSAPVSARVEFLMTYQRNRVPGALGGVGFSYSRLVGPNRIPLTIPSWMVYPLKRCAGSPYFMELCMSGGELNMMHRDYDATQRAMWLRTAFNNVSFAGDRRYLLPDVFIELCLALSCSEPQPALLVQRRDVRYGGGGIIDNAATAVAFARDAAHPGFFDIPSDIIGHSWVGLRSHAYQISSQRANQALSEFLSLDKISPRGPMVDASYDAGGLSPQITPTTTFSFMPVLAPDTTMEESGK